MRSWFCIISTHLEPVPAQIEKLQLYALIGWALCGLLSAVLQWGQPKRYAAPTEASPSALAAFVVLATGFAAALYFVLSDTPDLILAAGLAMITLMIAWPVYQFAKRHEAEIGEARFDTTGQASHRGDDS